MTEFNQNIFEEKKLGKARDFSLLKKLTPYVKPYRVLFIYTFILIIFITCLELVIPYITKIAIDRYIVPETAIETSIETNNNTPRKRYLSCDLSDPEVRKIAAAYPDLFQINKSAALIAYDQLPDLPQKTILKLRKNDLNRRNLRGTLAPCHCDHQFLFKFYQSDPHGDCRPENDA